MSESRKTDAEPPASRHRLVEATIHHLRTRGYAATRVDDICAAAGVTKGSFFHHFESKEAIVLSALNQWEAQTRPSLRTLEIGEGASGLLAFVDAWCRRAEGQVADLSCPAAAIVHEVQAQLAIREACARIILGGSDGLETLVAEAMADPGWRLTDASAGGLANHIRAVIQGAMVLSRATGDTAPAKAALGQLRNTLANALRPVPVTNAPVRQPARKAEPARPATQRELAPTLFDL